MDGIVEQSTMSDGYVEICGFCMAQGKNVEASMYCKQCSDPLCYSCTVTHRSQKFSEGHSIVEIANMPTKVEFELMTEECEPCSKMNKRIPASTFCQECGEKFCKNCSDMHQYQKMTQLHQLLSITEYKELLLVRKKQCTPANDQKPAGVQVMTNQQEKEQVQPQSQNQQKQYPEQQYQSQGQQPYKQGQGQQMYHQGQGQQIHQQGQTPANSGDQQYQQPGQQQQYQGQSQGQNQQQYQGQQQHYQTQGQQQPQQYQQSGHQYQQTDQQQQYQQTNQQQQQQPLYYQGQGQQQQYQSQQGQQTYQQTGQPQQTIQNPQQTNQPHSQPQQNQQYSQQGQQCPHQGQGQPYVVHGSQYSQPVQGQQYVQQGQGQQYVQQGQNYPLQLGQGQQRFTQQGQQYIKQGQQYTIQGQGQLYSQPGQGQQTYQQTGQPRQTIQNPKQTNQPQSQYQQNKYCSQQGQQGQSYPQQGQGQPYVVHGSQYSQPVQGQQYVQQGQGQQYVQQGQNYPLQLGQGQQRFTQQGQQYIKQGQQYTIQGQGQLYSQPGQGQQTYQQTGQPRQTIQNPKQTNQPQSQYQQNKYCSQQGQQGQSYPQQGQWQPYVVQGSQYSQPVQGQQYVQQGQGQQYVQQGQNYPLQLGRGQQRFTQQGQQYTIQGQGQQYTQQGQGQQPVQSQQYPPQGKGQMYTQQPQNQHYSQVQTKPYVQQGQLGGLPQYQQQYQSQGQQYQQQGQGQQPYNQSSHSQTEQPQLQGQQQTVYQSGTQQVGYSRLYPGQGYQCHKAEQQYSGQQQQRQQSQGRIQLSSSFTSTYVAGVSSQTVATQQQEQQQSGQDELRPGKPMVLDTRSDSVTLTWKAPRDIESRNCVYQIRFKGFDQKRWCVYPDSTDRATVTITGLKSECSYVFQVRCIFEDDDEEEGPYGPKSDEVKTSSSLALKLFPYTTKKEKGNPSVHKIHCTEIRAARNEPAKTRKFELGIPPIRKTKEKTILLVGATGSGKSTLVDGIINYVTGVNWNDPFRFTLVDLEQNEKHKSQTESQTEWITCYTINPQEGSRLDYKLTIIDTPGFGDTRGLERDNEIVGQVRELFSSKGAKGVVFIDAVCFLTKAPDARLTATQQYIFMSILSLFGQNIEENICTLITFADGPDPPVLEAIKKAKLPTKASYVFNHYCLFAKNTDDNSSLAPIFWQMGIESFKEFFTSLDKLTTKSLQQTQGVLLLRQRLELTIAKLQPQVDAGLNKVAELEQEIAILKKHEKEILDNKDFEYEVDETKQHKTPLPKGRHVTNCLNCNITCHENCGIPKDEDKKDCWAMDDNGYCRICDGKCFWQMHHNTPYVFSYITFKVKKTYFEKKEMYQKAGAEKISHAQVVQRMTAELNKLFDSIEDMMEEVNDCNTILKNIALHPNPLSMVEHIDLMIESEKMQRKYGFQKRINVLQGYRKRAEIHKDFDKLQKGLHSTVGRDARTERKKKRGVWGQVKHLFGM